ncbi:MAG: J domain-containing protein [Candidatus Competibacteraceae bacterium]|nr:J domain-containing protein [Candidatus Competibacteraceae bacterium]
MRKPAGPWTTNVRSLYDILEIASAASIEEVKEAFHRLAMLHHPDRNGGSPDAGARFTIIHNAYAILVSPESRRAYDAALRSSGQAESPPAAESTRRQSRWRRFFFASALDSLAVPSRRGRSPASSARPYECGAVGARRTHPRRRPPCGRLWRDRRGPDSPHADLH